MVARVVGIALPRQASHCLRRTNLASTIAAPRQDMRLPLPPAPSLAAGVHRTLAKALQ